MSYAVIIDFGHMFYRCWSIALQAPPTHDLVDTTVYHFHGVLRTLNKELSKRKIDQYDLIFTEDRTPSRKIQLLPTYRSNRTDRSNDKVRVKQALKDAGVGGHWCHSSDNEADDVIATLVRLSSARGVFSIIVTSDKDLWQLINPVTSVFDPMKKELVTLQDVGKAFPWKGFSVGPAHVALVKALWGDAGDCVPNACPRTQKQLLPIVLQASTGHLDEFKVKLNDAWSTLTPRCREVMTLGANQLDINWQLVRLDSFCQLQWD